MFIYAEHLTLKDIYKMMIHIIILGNRFSLQQRRGSVRIIVIDNQVRQRLQILRETVYLLIMVVMPGRIPLILSQGTTFTSKLFTSY